MTDEQTRRRNFRVAAFGALSMACLVVSQALPLMTGGGLRGVRATFLVIAVVLFVIHLVALVRYRPR